MGRGLVNAETILDLKDGRKYTLILSEEVIYGIEDREDRPLPEVMERAQRGFLTAVAAIAQAAFETHHPGLSRAHVLEIVRSDFEALTKALEEAIEKAFPDQQAGNAPAKPKRKRAASRKSTGKAGGASGAKQG